MSAWSHATRDRMKGMIWAIQRFGLTPDRIIRNLEVAPAPRLVCICIPKAGTHLLERALCLHPAFFRRLARTVNILRLSRWGGWMGLVHRLRPGRVILAHLDYDQRARDLLRSRGVKTAFLIRDPRDVVFSAVFYALKNRRLPTHRRIASLPDLKSRLQFRIKGDPPDGQDGIRHVLNRYAGWLTNSDVVVRFEDLVGPEGGGRRSDQREALSRLFRRLEVPLSRGRVDRIAEKLFFRSSPTFRRGRIGGWREAFDGELRELFEAEAGREARWFGY